MVLSCLRPCAHSYLQVTYIFLSYQCLHCQTKLYTVDKLTATYTVRIPESLKKELDALPPILKSKANQEVRVTLAKAVYDSKFNERIYLEEEGDLS